MKKILIKKENENYTFMDKKYPKCSCGCGRRYDERGNSILLNGKGNVLYITNEPIMIF